MKLSLRWLREFVDTPLDTAALCERLTMGGLEVDAVEERGEEIRGVVVGRIAATRPHPEAERLAVCEVETGSGPPATVVCGAANARPGIAVAFARDGAELPGGRRIGSAEIRGVASSGMLCSEAELGLADESEGILELSAEAPLGADVAEHLALRDTVLEISITPNRGDCLSVLGLAREIALLTGAELRRPRERVREKGAPAGDVIAVRIDDASGCRRYAARVVRGVRVGPSPLWLRLRLQAAGLRSINNVVDVTNLVMLERGQPLHAFDLRRLPRPEIVVRRAGEREALQTLDGVVRALDREDLVIATGAEPVAIAGVMGGADSEVVDETTDLLLESAWFDPSSVRRTARRLDLASEASYRFERGVDIDGVPAAVDRAAALITEVAGGAVAKGIIDVYPGRMVPRAIELRPQRVSEILGCAVSRDQVRSIMKALGAAVAKGEQGALAVTPPSFRSDLEREIDLVEEVARVVGYDRIPTTMPARPLVSGSVPARMRLEREIRELLRAAGLSEVVGLAFVSVEGNRLLPGVNVGGRAVELLNPLSKDEPQLRTSLLQSVVAMWRHNRNQNATAIAAFSLARSTGGTRPPATAARRAKAGGSQGFSPVSCRLPASAPAAHPSSPTPRGCSRTCSPTWESMTRCCGSRAPRGRRCIRARVRL
jgi:phenylalanyl-tRNA synthetase beta chain